MGEVMMLESCNKAQGYTSLNEWEIESEKT